MPPEEDSLNTSPTGSISRSETSTETEYLNLRDPQPNAAPAAPTESMVAATKAARGVRNRLWFTRGMMIFLLVGVIAAMTGSVLWLRNRSSTIAGPADLIRPTSLSLETGKVSSPTTGTTATSQLAVNGDLSVAGVLSLTPQAITNLAASLGTKVDLQPSINAVAQTGNIAVTGQVRATNFLGDGALLNNLNASALSSGIVDDARLNANITRFGQSIPLSALSGNIVSSINNVTNNAGNIQFVAGTNVTITPDNVNKTITIDASAIGGGTISGVTAGTGLTGGGLFGNVALSVDGTVTQQGNAFNGASQLVQTTIAGALPALSGVNITNLNAGNVSSGTLSDGRLSSNVTLQGNTFNGINQLVQLNGAGELPAVSGTNLTNLNATNVASGTLSNARLNSTVTLQGNSFNGSTQLVQTTVAGALPALSGTNLTNLNATNISSGTLADARLSANVAFLNAANQTFTGNQTITGSLTVDSIQPTTSLTLGSSSNAFTLQGTTASTIKASSGGFTTTLAFAGTPVGNVTYSLDTATAAGSYTICTSVGNCASSGGGVTTLGGTTNRLARFTGAQSIGDGSITDTGSAVTVAATGQFRAGSNSTSAFQIQNSAGTSNLLIADTTNTRLAVGQASATYTLDVAGDINSTTGLRVGGNLVCDSTGCSSTPNSGFYIQNGLSLQTNANINIESTATSSVVAILKGKSGQSADLFQTRDGSNAIVAQIDPNGNLNVTGQYRVGGTQISSANLSNDSNIAKRNANQSFTGNNTFTGTVLSQNAADSTSAFSIQNAAGTSNLLIADTINNRIAIGKAVPGYTLDVNGDVNINTGSSYRINGVSICGPSASCAPAAGSSSYIQNTTSIQAAANFSFQSAAAGSVGGVIRGAAAQSADLFQLQTSTPTTVLSVSATGETLIRPSTNSTTAFRVQNAAGSSDILRADTSNTRIGIGYSVDPSYTLDVNGDINSATALRVGGISVCTSSGCLATSGNTNYIQNSTGLQTSANFNVESTSTGAVTGILKGISGQTADVFQVKDGSNNTTASVGATGNTVFRTTTNSSSAFQVQNAASQSLFSVDSTNSKVQFNSAANGELNAWTTNSNALGAAAFAPTSIIVNGYMYNIGPSSTVYYYPVNADGSLGAASTTSTLPFASGYGGLVSNNGYLYATNGGSANVVYARINSDGTLSAWTNVTSLPANSFGSNQMVVANGYVYLVGGGPSYSAIYYAQINVDGSLGSWTTSGVSLPSGRILNGTVVANGYLIVTGGSTDVNTGQSTVYSAKLNTNGTIGSFVSTTSLPAVRYSHSTVSMNGYIYVIAGTPNTAANEVTTIYYGRVSSTGTISAWTTATNSLPAARASQAVASANGYIYISGGGNTSSVAQSTIFYTSGARVQMIGNLDLIGLNGGALSDAPGAGGGNIYAGKIFSNNDLEVTGSATFNGGATVNSTFSVRGTSAFQSATNTTNAFQFQNASAATVLNVDTTNRRIGINTTAPTASLDVRPTAIGDIGFFIRQIASSTSDILQFQNSSSAVIFAIDATGAIVNGDAFGGPPQVGIDPNSGAGGDYTSGTGPFASVATADGFGNFYNDVQPGTVYTANAAQTGIFRCTLPTTRLPSSSNAYVWVYLTADTTTGANGRSCTINYSATMPTFNARYPFVVISFTCISFSGFSCGHVDMRYYLGGTLAYVNTQSAVTTGQTVINDTASDNRVTLTASAASNGAAGIIVVGNTAAGRAIMMTQGYARGWAGAATSRGSCVQTTTGNGYLQVTNTPAVGTCFGQAVTTGGGFNNPVLVRVDPY